VPVPLATSHRFSGIDAGGSHSCGVAQSGAAYCWGSNHAGQLGNGTVDATAVPVAVGGGVRFTMVSSGRSHTCGVAEGGSGYCWGSNQYGELATTGTDFPGRPGSVYPALVHGQSQFKQISAGDGYSCGVAQKGSAHCWGAGEHGQLGNGGTRDWATPQWVNDGFTSVSAGLAKHTCGVSSSAEALCWGTGRTGQLGRPTTIITAVPVKVAGPR
jgi:alpha-tubulin suppressor-like RCC1 family protein